MAVSHSSLPKLIVILGPTSAGKTALSLDLAEYFHGEIVSADSRQVYTGLTIGTNKVSTEDRARIPHHLLDVIDPAEQMSVAEYKAIFRGSNPSKALR